MDKIVSTIVHVLEQHADEYTDVQAAQAIADAINKPFRQQLGRELLNSEHMGQYANKVVTDIIVEVCQLDEVDK